MKTIRILSEWEKTHYPLMIINMLNKSAGDQLHSCIFDDEILIENIENEIFITFYNLKVIRFKDWIENLHQLENIPLILIGDMRLKYPTHESGFASFDI
jgi:hypothetical protein